MALKPNAPMRYMGYEIRDNDIVIRCISSDPGPGEPSDYECILSDIDLTGVLTENDFENLVKARLKRKFRAQGLAAKLDPYIGRAFTV